MFVDRLKDGMRESNGSVCVGLDPSLNRLPASVDRTAEGVEAFLGQVIDRTAEHACVYKPNSAFYEALGSAGMDVLGRTIEQIHARGRPVILDAKRGDIASTAEAYAEAAFGVLGADAITVVPYMGEDAITPFLERGGFTFILTLPTNPSAGSIVDHGAPPLYERVAAMASGLAERYPGQVGLVVGATRPKSAGRLHQLARELPWLVPGVGAQGGSVDAFREAIGGEHLMVVNASRSIVFAADPVAAALELKQRIKGSFDARS